MREPPITALYGCAETLWAPRIDSWPEYVCDCESCGRPFRWTGAHFESGMHYYCPPCSGYPFFGDDETYEYLDGSTVGSGQDT